MATVRVRIVILTVRITLSVCPFNRMAHTANSSISTLGEPRGKMWFEQRQESLFGNYVTVMKQAVLIPFHLQLSE
jgi:hypothetical protein